MSESTDRWNRIQSVLEQALELDRAELASFLERTCAGDQELRREIESLIAADRSAPEFLDGRAFELPVQPASTNTSLLGRRIGPYRVSREIGKGGMSVVYAGERADGQFEQHVAIKVLPQDPSTAELAERFHIERRILGSLDHRAIVHIFDAGVLDDGRPYLVMEYIEGKRIDAWCDARRLPIDDRLRLFRQVLDAVAYAHRALVVHRDLKPDNVLVDQEGNARLLDFGIAKLLDEQDPSAALPTRTGLRAMTPEYAAPEQLRGDRITTACDIYALGVLFYELIAGHRPYHLRAITPYAVERAILESDPARPSDAVRRIQRNTDDAAQAIAAARRTEPFRLSNTLDGDLDAIALKALRKEPEERYVSADAFADDIDRYLGSQPVLARRGSRAYRIRKFVRRHRIGVGVAAASAALILGASAVIAASRVSAEKARVQAEREARTAHEVTDFLIGLFAGSDPYENLGDSVSARTLLERGRERIGQELLGEPLVRASLLDAIGRVYSGLGRYEAADTLLRQAAELRVAELGPDDISLAESYHALGRNRIAWRDFAGALDNLERALAVHERLANGDSARLIIMASLAVPLREIGQPDSARKLLEQVLANDRARGDSTSLAHLGHRLNLGATLRAADDLEGAMAIYRDLLPRLRETAGTDHPHYSTALNNAAYLHSRLGEWAEAVPLYREALDIALPILGPGHPRIHLLQANLASALYESGSPDQALAILDDRLASTRLAFPGGHWRVGSAQAGIGKLLTNIGRFEAAETAFREAVASYAATIGAEHTWTLVAETWVVLTMALRGDVRGNALLDRAIARLDGVPLDGDTRADIDRIANHLEAAGLITRAEGFRAIRQKEGSESS